MLVTKPLLVNGPGRGAGAWMFPFALTLMDKIETWSLTWLPILLMVALVYLIWRTLKMMPRTKPQQIRPESSGSIDWDDVAGCEEAKDELREVVEFLRRPDRFKKLGATVPKGILLHGPPGTGKTLLAKAVARESGAQFFSQSASAFVEMFAGLGAARIRRLFAIAKKHRPAIIFIDELDAIGLQRGFDLSREKDQTLNQLLVEMDGFEDRGELVVIAASNRVDGLDPALMRPGRFDRQVLVSPPDLVGREAILKVHTRNKPLDDDVDLEIVARRTSGLTGADLANLCNEAAIFAGRQGRATVTAEDFDAAHERVVAGLQSRKVITPEEKRVIAYHEAGHALISELLPSVPRVHKISIIPRGHALGYTLNISEEDRYLRSKPELLDYLKVLLGGYVAELVVFHRTTTGAADDLRRVVEMSRAMIEEYGMGSRLFLGKGLAGESFTSEASLRRRDEEQQGLVDEALFDARMLITDNRETLDLIGEALLAKETLDRFEIRALVKPEAPDDSSGPSEEERAEEVEAEAAEEREPNGSIGPPGPRPSVPPPGNGSGPPEESEPAAR
jgi:cell division protease FtsH